MSVAVELGNNGILKPAIDIVFMQFFKGKKERKNWNRWKLFYNLPVYYFGIFSSPATKALMVAWKSKKLKQMEHVKEKQLWYSTFSFLRKISPFKVGNFVQVWLLKAVSPHLHPIFSRLKKCVWNMDRDMKERQRHDTCSSEGPKLKRLFYVLYFLQFQ